MRFAGLLLFSLTLTVAAQEIPRPEYPQPQFQRENWLTLNGTWEFDFDDTNQGLAQDWATGTRKFTRSILVPFCFESKKSGIGDTSFHPWVWYRRTFTIPNTWSGKRVLLHFGAVDYHATVWVNGKRAGEHEGGSVPFRFDVTEVVKPGSNTVVVRAEDPPTDRYLPRGKQYWELKSRSIFYTRTTGIWQPVWLEATGQSYLEFVRIHPSADGAVRFDGRIARAVDGMELTATVKRGNNVVAMASSAAIGPRVSTGAIVRDPALWSPGNPNLYDVTFELKRGAEVLDRVQSYFGYRSIGIEEGRFVLNNRPLYLKFVLDQGYWPESTLTPPSDEAIQYDIRLTKEMGFNGARKHQKLEDPRFLYWADKMGLLVSSEAANAYLYDEQYAARFTREWIESVERDFNHPSIVMWVPINESWGTPNLRDPRQQAHLRALYSLTKSLDPGRPVIDNDGWEHVETTDLFAVHDYAPTGARLMERWGGFTKTKQLPPLRPSYLAHGIQYNGTPLYLSEFGGIAYIPEGHQVPAESWGYSGVEKTKESALARLRGQYEAIAKLPFMGICYTQLTDVEQEVNGLLTYDRKPKFDSKVLREINSLLQ